MIAAPLASPQNQNPFTAFVARYYDDRVAFAREVLKVTLEAWQENELRALDKGAKRISIRSGHGVGKTMFLAIVILHFAFTRFPSKTAVTAPSAPQLFDALAAEVKIWLRVAEANCPFLAGILSTTSDRVFMTAAPESVFCTYRTSRKDNPEALQGIHAEHVLLIADEGSGVEDTVYEAASGSMSTPGAITILAGNPTRASGFFYQTHTNPKLKARWRAVRVSCFDSKRVDAAYIDEERAFGETSNRFRVRVLGEFPEGDDDTLIARSQIEAAVKRKIIPIARDPVFWGVDVARFGDDASTLAKRRGAVVPAPVQRWRGLNLMQLCGKIVAEHDTAPEKDKPEAIFVDVIGLGAGVVDRLQELGLPAVAVNVAEAASFVMPQAMRLRDELWMHARDWFSSLKVQFPDDPVTIDELAQPRVAYTSTGKTKVESKDEMRSRGVGSPDGADGFCLTFARQMAIGAGAMTGTKSIKGPLKRKGMRRV